MLIWLMAIIVLTILECGNSILIDKYMVKYWHMVRTVFESFLEHNLTRSEERIKKHQKYSSIPSMDSKLGCVYECDW